MSDFLTKERYEDMWKRGKGKTLELPEGKSKPLLDEYGYLILSQKSAQAVRTVLFNYDRASACLSLPNGTALVFHIMKKMFILSGNDGKGLDTPLRDLGPSRSNQYVVCTEYGMAFGFGTDHELHPNYLEEKLRMPYGDGVYFAPWLTEVLKMKEEKEAQKEMNKKLIGRPVGEPEPLKAFISPQVLSQDVNVPDVLDEE